MPKASTTSVACSHDRRLTDAQLSVIRCVALGLTDREIARALSLSQNTVRHHLSESMQATGARSRAHVVAICFVTGLLGTGHWPPEIAEKRCLHPH